MNQRLPSYLKGEALRHWPQMAARDRSSYDRVKVHILSKLDTVQRRWNAKTEYFSATQSAGESTTEFARDYTGCMNSLEGKPQDVMRSYPRNF